ncbi:HemK-related putative methylase [Halovivax ruber XH-70]|uniref:HemK-related putative methylase n=1 Tax=Halovivax ruber (strain DSM 18193 / JCM 13892 / XH-70) TaxID=797302 RepID=L0ICN8_HALRX|nr:HemK2/MTQ2 family protein methyltransferase [Halovivax ruber]AGB15991.1 HemK-related putative methylase [Halovivax ruber XH-70]
MDLAERRGMETDVYQPATDSRLLAEAAIDRLSDRPTGRVLEVGTGSGYVAGQVRSALEWDVVASDLNPNACLEARDRGLDVVRGDLVEPFGAERFDAVVFNPPYLPTDPSVERDDWMEVALSGGPSGRAVVEPFLETVRRVLRPDGVVLLLVSSLTGMSDVTELAGDAGFSAIAVTTESFPYESLTVLELIQ